jgi:hypothetical protein
MPGGRDRGDLLRQLERLRMRHLERRAEVHLRGLRWIASTIFVRPWPALTHHRPGDAVEHLAAVVRP